MPTAAEALCSTAVNAAPARMPRAGFENVVSMSIKVLLCRSGATAPLMDCIPNIKTAKPSRISPVWRFVGSLQNMRSTTPITATMADIVAVEKSAACPPDLKGRLSSP